MVKHAPEATAPAALAGRLAAHRVRSRSSACRTSRPARATRCPGSSRRTASGWAPRRRPGTTSPGCASSGTARSWSRASAAPTRPAVPSTPVRPRSRCRTTAATTSTARRRRSGCCPRSSPRSAIEIEVVMDGGIRRGSDVVKALALGAKAVMIGRAYLWGLAANGQAGVENVLDVLRMGIDSTLLGLGKSSIAELSRRPRHPRRLHPAARGLTTRRTPRPSAAGGVAGGSSRCHLPSDWLTPAPRPHSRYVEHDDRRTACAARSQRGRHHATAATRRRRRHLGAARRQHPARHPDRSTMVPSARAAGSSEPGEPAVQVTSPVSRADSSKASGRRSTRGRVGREQYCTQVSYRST